VDRRLLRIALALALASPATAAGAHAELPPPAAGLPGGTVDPALDTTPPQLALDGRRAQPLSPVLEAYATCSERCQFDASARVRGVPSLDFLRVVTPTKASERVSPRADRLIEAALRAGRRVRVKVAVTAYDLAGNDTSHSLRIRVLPQT
jgi:hypothetical protein